MKKNILTLVLLGTLVSVGAYAQAPATTTRQANGAAKKGGDKENFKEMDKDSDGKLSKAEVDASDRKHLKKNFATIDANSDGFITKQELKAYKASRPRKEGKKE